MLSQHDNQIYNLYCDESCHLEKDNHPIMGFGAIWCPKSEVKRLSLEVRKRKNIFKANGELKWGKTTLSKIDFYLDLIEWFFYENSIHFRAVIVRNKNELNHDSFNLGFHDTFYYKMYFSLLREILDPQYRYNVYLDIKDTKSAQKLQKLSEVLCNNVYDFTGDMIQNIQNIRSHESELMQLSDFLLGAVSYRNRNLSSSRAKKKIVEKIEDKTKLPLTYSTSKREEKFNLFLFTPQKKNERI
jgi:hypothetical protein